ncbi:MAG: type II toxin-antitoxin system HicB family antitoxin [Bacteroidales bacterium]|nr:type II toxin-antitoxin system HicB family antitoxin [Bacteroidales bacterium]
MKTVDITISVAKDGFYCACCDECAALFGGGKTPEAAVEELKETLRLVKEDGKEAALYYPEWLDGEYSFQTHWDVETMLRYYAGIITPAALGKLSGIHPKQLWSYMHGKTKPRKAQVARIEKAVHQLGQQLLNITF